MGRVIGAIFFLCIAAGFGFWLVQPDAATVVQQAEPVAGGDCRYDPRTALYECTQEPIGIRPIMGASLLGAVGLVMVVFGLLIAGLVVLFVSRGRGGGTPSAYKHDY